MRPTPFLLVSAVALVAQAPANPNLAQRFNAELPAVSQMLKEFKTQEAMARVQELIPAQPSSFDISSGKALGESMDNANGLMSLYGLWAKTASANGLWEKAVEIQEKRAQAARAVLANLDAAQAPLLDQWKKVSQDSGDYVAKNAPRQQELEASLKALKEEVDAVNAKTKKLDSKGMEALKARIAKGNQEQQELDQIVAALPVHKTNLENAPKITKMLGDNRKEIERLVKATDEALARSKKSVADQQDEITQFNTQQVVRKVKVVGKKTWVDAVLRAPENVTKQGGPEEQAAFLNRMLVLDPGNAGAQKALNNLKAGKEAFAKEARPAKKAGVKKAPAKK